MNADERGWEVLFFYLRESALICGELSSSFVLIRAIRGFFFTWER
jgi:hypothetical protein